MGGMGELRWQKKTKNKKLKIQVFVVLLTFITYRILCDIHEQYSYNRNGSIPKEEYTDK